MISDEDYSKLEEQLGRKPRGVVKVLRYNSSGDPQVVQVAPLVEGRPFPSMYWLSCPRLHKAIAKIEQSSWIKHLENIVIPGDLELKEKLRKDHLRYQRLRWESLTPDQIDSVETPKYLESLKSTGVGGVRDFSRVRCLHMHYAHHLVEENCIGQLMDQEFETHLYL
jgi:hypothetical protein